MKQYRLAYKSKKNESEGRGCWDFNREDVQVLVDLGNKIYPEITHWVEEREAIDG